MNIYQRGLRVRIGARRAVGQIVAPPSKSVAHRMLICAALAKGESVLSGISFSQDILATIDVLCSLGAEIVCEEGTGCVRINGIGGRPAAKTERSTLCCRESGSTLRFSIPICLLSEQAWLLQGSARLLSRPLEVYRSLFSERVGRAAVNDDGGELLLERGTALTGGDYRLPGDVSSQFISGLLFALPLCERDSTLELTTAPESGSYISLTLDIQRRFGVHATWQADGTSNRIFVPGRQEYRLFTGEVEGDASNAAFLEALNCFGGSVEVTGLRENSLQGDRVYAQLFRRIVACRADERPVIDLADCPDLAPILFTIAAAHGGALFTHTDRLRSKECDRILAMQTELAKFGGCLVALNGNGTCGAGDTAAAALRSMRFEQGVRPDREVARNCGGMVCVCPAELHAPQAPLYGHNDHRVVMSLAILATAFGGVIEGAEAVQKSFPDFFAALSSLGIATEQENKPAD